MALAEALRERGAREIHSFAHGADALAALQTITPSLLIMDFQLADSSDGYGLAEVASQIFVPPPHLIFATAEPDRLPKRLSKAGRIFPKPYDLDDLAAFAAAL